MSKQYRPLAGPDQTDWWLGITDVATIATAHTAAVAERMHIAIADETFRVLNAIPVVRTASQPVQQVHHGIARCCYGSVQLASVGLNQFIRLASRLRKS